MALQLAFTTVHGIKLSDAYHRIVNLRVRKTKEGTFQSYIAVATYVDAASRAAGNIPVTPRHYKTAYYLNSKRNAFMQAYAYLKTLDEFAGASDV